MSNPYKILGIDEQVNDQAIKQAYLQQVRLYPPERDQERFQQIHEAYKTLKDKQSRLKHALFNYPEADFDSVLDEAFQFPSTSLITADDLTKLLAVSLDEQTLQGFLLVSLNDKMIV